MEQTEPSQSMSVTDLAVMPDAGPEEKPLDMAVDWVLRELATQVIARHEQLRRTKGLPDDPPGVLPTDRALTAGEAFELAQYVYTLACATRSSLARCEPGLVLLAAMWRASPDERAWVWFSKAQLS